MNILQWRTDNAIRKLRNNNVLLSMFSPSSSPPCVHYCPRKLLIPTNSGDPPLPLGEGRGEGSLAKSNANCLVKKYFPAFLQSTTSLLWILPSPRPSPRGRGGSPRFIFKSCLHKYIISYWYCWCKYNSSLFSLDSSTPCAGISGNKKDRICSPRFPRKAGMTTDGVEYKQVFVVDNTVVLGGI